MGLSDNHRCTDVAVTARQRDREAALEEQRRKDAKAQQQRLNEQSEERRQNLIEKTIEEAQCQRDRQAVEQDIRAVDERILEKAPAPEEDLWLMVSKGIGWLAGCAVSTAGAVVFTFLALQFLLAAWPFVWRVISACSATVITVLVLHAWSRKHYPIAEDGRPQFSKLFFACLVVLVLASAVGRTWVGSEYSVALEKKKRGELKGEEAERTIERLQWEGAIANTLLALSLEGVAAVASTYGTGLIYTGLSGLWLYRLRRRKERKALELDKRIIALSIETDDLQERLDTNLNGRCA